MEYYEFNGVSLIYDAKILSGLNHPGLIVENFFLYIQQNYFWIKNKFKPICIGVSLIYNSLNISNIKNAIYYTTLNNLK